MDNSAEQPQEKRTFQFTLKQLLWFVTAMGVFFSLCALVIHQAKESWNCADCIGLRLGFIQQALRQYHDKYGHFPPAYISDSNGKPMHSWRVLLLEFLDENLYKRYDFSEPWNGPKNSLLVKEYVDYFCPSANKENKLSTNYVAVVGPNTAWTGEKAVWLKDITDYPSTTIVIVEVADSDINWMEPRDMTFHQAIAGINMDRKHGISSDHRGGVYCIMANYSIQFLKNDTAPDVIKAMLTIKGSESIVESNDGDFSIQPKGLFLP